MFAVDVCRLPATGGSTFVVAAGLFLLIAGVIVTRWVRASAGRMSVVVAPLVLLGGLVLAPSVSDPCSPTTTVAPTTTVVSTTTVAPTTTVVPVDPNLVLEIDTTVRVPVEIDSVTAAGESFVFELGLWGEVDVHVDWGDGLADNVTASGPFPHTYTTSGQYTITVSGSLTGFGQDPLNFVLPLNGAHYLKAVRSFGELGITSFAYAFLASVNLIYVPSNLPATVTDMSAMFAGASSFNQSLNNWDTGLVTTMGAMFAGASSFNQSLNNWDTGLVSDMSNMFFEASSFNGDVSGWDTGLVTNMSNMFLEARSFNGDVSGWDTGLVTNMSYMFSGASLFNQSLDSWGTSSVYSMNGMFQGASLFNQNLDSWDTSSVTFMGYMFQGASSFNQNLDSWDTSSVTHMSYVFDGASSFNQSLGAWDISEVIDMRSMLDGSALSVNNYDATLNGWADSATQSDVTLGAAGLHFSNNGAFSHEIFTQCPFFWSIFDEGNQDFIPTSLSDSDQPVSIACN